MQGQLSARKRTAPGASPAVPQRPGMGFPAVQDVTNMASDQYPTWNGSDAFNSVGEPYADASVFDGNFFNPGMNDSIPQGNGATMANSQSMNSNQLVRRDRNQHLAAINRPAWQDFGGGGNTQTQGWENSDDEEGLEARALAAKREAQAKRKQIPPFVQKLSSFLDEKRNTDLIRWSDDGLSFIVLNEDEFAKTLIPELFKHNNYPSFVRQLNMYGFHKKVGLSDNSMKSSEQKVKTPSEYYNKYFRRGRPELLWLIQKPKNSGSSKRKRDDDKTKPEPDSDGEGKKYQPEPEVGPAAEDGLVRRNQEMALIPMKEINSLRRELQQVQRQQQIISAHINKIKQQNEQLYHQATAFQTLHERHENSINAILTFLATFYNRQLDQNSVPNLQDMFQHAIPQSQQPHGNVVDVGDYHDGDIESSTVLSRGVKRPLALLPAPSSKEATSPEPPGSRAQAIRSPSVRPSSRQRIFKPSISVSKSPSVNQKTPPVTTRVDNGNTQPAGNDDIMSVINNANANIGGESPKFDFAAALNHFQNSGGNSPLTPQQRMDMLSMMAANSPTGDSSNSAANNNNALINPNPPPMPSLDEFAATQAQLDLLQKMQEEQDNKVQNIAERLQPLSPSGTIPGFVPNGSPVGSNFSLNNYQPGTGDQDLDLSNFINSDDYFADPPGGGHFTGANIDSSFPDMDLQLDGQPMDFNSGFGLDDGSSTFDGTGVGHTGTQPNTKEDDDGRVESISSESTSQGAGSPLSSPKKKRKKL